MNNGLENLLNANGIALEDGQQVIYEALRLQCFATVCEALRKDRKLYLEELRKFRGRMDRAAFSREMVWKYCACRLDEASYDALGELFACFFRKDDSRLRYSKRMRRKLAQRQEYHCAICGEPITEEAELDHKIAWIYVGDRLEDNLQLLCHACNNGKRASLIYPLQVLLRYGCGA